MCRFASGVLFLYTDTSIEDNHMQGNIFVSDSFLTPDHWTTYGLKFVVFDYNYLILQQAG